MLWRLAPCSQQLIGGRAFVQELFDLNEASNAQHGIGTVVLIACLLGLLVLAIIWAISVWSASSDGAPMGAHGWIALGLGTFFSLAIGGGLMTLMFYSAKRSRRDGQPIATKARS
jgi:sulfite exporter TauE/SafE